jgi:hypothetical protein
VIASHYADPVECHLNSAAELQDAPGSEGEVIASLAKGDAFAALDSTLGWAWGYAGSERRVGYVESSKIGR